MSSFTSNNSESQVITTHDDTPKTQDGVTFPSYLLQDVFVHLPLLDLINCQKVCRLWRTILKSRRALRPKLFIKQQDEDSIIPIIEEPSNDVVFDLHPIFSLIHFDSSVCAEDTTFGRNNSAYLKDSAVRNHYATSPVTTRISLEVLKFHPNCVVENPTGVTVWDVIVQLVEYKKKSVKINFQTFFGSSICNKRGYDRMRRMRNADFLGKDSVFISFSEGSPEDNRLFIASSFEARKGIRKGKLFRFWSAFAFCDDLKM